MKTIVNVANKALIIQIPDGNGATSTALAKSFEDIVLQLESVKYWKMVGAKYKWK